MGYGYYHLPDGREAGYGVEAVCDEPACVVDIDRGLAFLCGDAPLGLGLRTGCGGYFCRDHLFLCAGRRLDGRPTSACGRCADAEDRRLALRRRIRRGRRLRRLRASRG